MGPNDVSTMVPSDEEQTLEDVRFLRMLTPAAIMRDIDPMVIDPRYRSNFTAMLVARQQLPDSRIAYNVALIDPRPNILPKVVLRTMIVDTRTRQVLYGVPVVRGTSKADLDTPLGRFIAEASNSAGARMTPREPSEGELNDRGRQQALETLRGHPLYAKIKEAMDSPNKVIEAPGGFLLRFRSDKRLIAYKLKQGERWVDGQEQEGQLTNKAGSQKVLMDFNDERTDAPAGVTPDMQEEAARTAAVLEAINGRRKMQSGELVIAPTRRQQRATTGVQDLLRGKDGWMPLEKDLGISRYLLRRQLGRIRNANKKTVEYFEEFLEQVPDNKRAEFVTALRTLLNAEEEQDANNLKTPFRIEAMLTRISNTLEKNYQRITPGAQSND
jgi:hypothetical protein